MKTMNLIGCGAVGQTLGRLFHEAEVVEVQDILTTSLERARQAAEFIGAGRPVSHYDRMRQADLFLIGVPDDGIAGCAAELAASGLVADGTVVCHLSGALSSSVLDPITRAGGLVASVHPVNSFADPQDSIGSFVGTWCGIEGAPGAIEVLTSVFSSIGGQVFSVDPRFKSIYHAGAVLVCNYLTALLETGVRAYEKGGLDRETALEVMEPLVRGTVDNIFRVGTVQALTGPIARGDGATVARQLEALDEWDGQAAGIYRALGQVALELSRARGNASQESLKRIEGLLARDAKLV